MTDNRTLADTGPRAERVSFLCLAALALCCAGCGDAMISSSGPRGGGGGGGTIGTGDAGVGGNAGAATGGSAGSGGSGGAVGGNAGAGGNAGSAGAGGSGGSAGSSGSGGSAGTSGNGGSGGTLPMPTPGAEARYAELCANGALGCYQSGGGGSCSEPLQNDDLPQWSDPSNDLYDASDSPSETECSAFGVLSDSFSAFYATRPMSTPLPAGAEPGRRELAYYSPGITNFQTTGSSVCDNNAQRVCFRYYRRWAPGYPDVWEEDHPQHAGCSENKITMADIDGVTNGLQSATQNNQIGVSLITGVNDYGGAGFSPTLSQHDCEDGWCRFEYCFSGPGVCGGGAMDVDVSVVELHTGVTHEVHRNVETTQGLTFGPWLNGWHTCTQGPDDWQAVAYLLYAEWPTNNGQQIGPAHEMEGQ